VITPWGKPSGQPKKTAQKRKDECRNHSEYQRKKGVTKMGAQDQRFLLTDPISGGSMMLVPAKGETDYTGFE
jgi:hypothetical protein